MKKLYFLTMLLFCHMAYAQQGINYKAIINDADGNVLANAPVTVQFTILENETTDVYKESHNTTTNVNGIVIVNIGEGTPISGDFNSIDWGSNPHFLKTEIDIGNGLTDMGTTGFKAVPYAFYAKTAKNISGSYTETQSIADVAAIDNNVNNQLKNITDPTDAQDAATKAYVDLLINRIEYLENIMSEYLFNDDIDNDDDGFTENEGDCNDFDASIYPGATEICGDGIDQDCDGNDLPCNPPDIDNDGDGYTENEGDCDDNDASIYPGTIEICGDGIDQDCDGSDLICPEDIDDDGDGFTENEGDCDDNNASISPIGIEICDGLDNDCNVLVDDGPQQNICPLTDNVVTTTCHGGECVITACTNGWCDNDGIFANGCETQIDSDPDCSSFLTLPSLSNNGGFLTYTSNRESWYRIYIEDAGDHIFERYQKVTISLYSADAINFDLYGYNEECGTITASSENATSVDEIYYQWVDNPFIDDGRYIYIEVRYNSGVNCEDYELEINCEYYSL